MPVNTRQRGREEFQNLESIPIAVIAGKTEQASGLEPETGIIGRVSKQDDEIIAEPENMVQPGAHQAGPDARTLEFGQDSNRARSQARARLKAAGQR